MPRCAPWLATLAWLALSDISAAQQRNFPATALRGELRIGQPPEVLLNGRPARLAPGSRIRDTQNMLAMSGALVGQPLRVNYTLDTQGGILDVWVLTAAERARQPWPTSLEQARAWSFDAAAQTWSRP
ncbi:MAG: hypothetical protein H7Z19_16350 [Chitinophagaceae bacterium]|nr:hypothetical protein [Rubrivivax sp.]